MWSSLVILLLPSVIATRWSEYPAFSSGPPRNLHSLTASSLVDFLKSSNLSVIWFHPKNISSSDKLNYFLLRESFLAPASSRVDIPFAEFPITNDSLSVIQTLNVNESDIDTIHIYSNLRRIIYYGLRTPDALVSALKKFQCPKFTVIEGKTDKKEFDLEDKVRVLALVVPGSSFARAYAKASLAFNRNIVKFYVITNPTVATRYGLTAGVVQLHRPGERSFVELSNPRSSADMIAFVKEEAGKSFFQTHRLTTENIYSFFRDSYDQPKFVLLTSSSHSPRSARFHKMIRRSIRNDTNCQIYVIDVDQFPGMANFWRRTFGVDASDRPVLGYVSLHNDTAIWLDRSLFNETDGRDAELQNNRAVSDFVGSILNGTVSLKRGRRIDPETGHLMAEQRGQTVRMADLSYGDSAENEVFIDTITQLLQNDEIESRKREEGARVSFGDKVCEKESCRKEREHELHSEFEHRRADNNDPLETQWTALTRDLETFGHVNSEPINHLDGMVKPKK